MKGLLLAGAYLVLCNAYLLVGMRSEHKLLKAAMKSAPILLLLSLAGKTMIDSAAPVSASAPGSVENVHYLFWGLLFSSFGDIYLVFQGYFLYGLISFAIAQAIYISLFGGGVALVAGLLSPGEMAAGATVAVVSLSVYVYVFPKMKSNVLRLAGFLYCVLISVMVWSAIVQALRKHTDLSAIGAVGASLFFCSDVVLSLDRFGGMKIPFVQAVIMMTYYCGQLFILASVLDLR